MNKEVGMFIEKMNQSRVNITSIPRAYLTWSQKEIQRITDRRFVETNFRNRYTSASQPPQLRRSLGCGCGLLPLVFLHRGVNYFYRVDFPFRK